MNPANSDRSMRGIRLMAAVLLLALAAALPARAQDAADYFHGAAYKFVAGRLQEASVQAEEGVRKYPDDVKLKSLADHLRRMKNQQRQDQNSGGSSQSGDKGQDQKDKQGSSGDQDGNKDKEEKKDDQKQGPEDDQGKEGQDQAKSPESEDKGGKDSTGEGMAPVKPGEMSKEDAERLLNSIQDDEKKEHKQQQRRYRKRVEVEQDW